MTAAEQIQVNEGEAYPLSWRPLEFVEAEYVVWVHSWVRRGQEDSGRCHRAVDGLPAYM